MSAIDGDIAGLQDLVIQYGHACRREGSLPLGNDLSASIEYANACQVTNALANRIKRRIVRLELLANMAGIEPSDVRGALVGIWRN
jgi:hypothetical protein